MATRKKKVVRKIAKPAKRKVKKAVKNTKGKKKLIIKIKKTPEITLENIGEITHYFPHVKAAAVKLLKSGITVGDEIYIKGHTTDFKEKVRSIQLDHAPITVGKKGQEIGLFVKSRVRIGDKVYKV